MIGGDRPDSEIQPAEPDQFRDEAGKHGTARPVTIRVLDVGTGALDLATSDGDTLHEALALVATRWPALAAPEGRPAAARGAARAARGASGAARGASEFPARAFAQLARVLRAPPAALRGAGGAGDAEAAGSTLPELAARALGTAPGLRPVASRAPPPASAAARTAALAPELIPLRARFAECTKAASPSGEEIAFAAEEPALIAGFAVDGRAAAAAGRGSRAREPPRFPGRDAARAGLAAPRSLVRGARPARAGLARAPFTQPAGGFARGAKLLRRRGFAVAGFPPGAAAGPAAAALLRMARAAAALPGGGAASAAASAASYRPPGDSPGDSIAAALVAAPAGAPAAAHSRQLALLADSTTGRSPGGAQAVGDLAVVAGGLEAYRAAATHSGRSPVAAAWLAAVAAARAARPAVAAAAEARRVRLAARAVMLRAVADTLGARRAAAAAAGAADEAAVRAALTPAERRVVDAAVAAAEAANSGDPKCAHRAAARAAATAPPSGAAAALAALEPLLARPAADGWAGCRRCRAPHAACGHVLARARLAARGATYAEMRGGLMQFMSHAVIAASDQLSIFCRVCGAHLADGDSEADPNVPSDSEMGPLRARIWQTAAAAAARIAFPTPVDEKVFAARAASAVGPAVARMLPRRRATADDELDPLSEVLAVAGAYAFVLEAARAALAAGRPLGYGGVAPGAPVSRIAGAILADLARTASGALAQVSGVTPAWLRDRFAELFRALRVDTDGGDAPPDPAAELASVIGRVDTAFRWAAAAAALAGAAPPLPPATPADARRIFETALGAPLPAVLARARAALADPALAPVFATRLGAEIPAGTDIELLRNDPRLNFHRDLYAPGSFGKDDVEKFAELATNAAVELLAAEERARLLAPTRGRLAALAAGRPPAASRRPRDAGSETLAGTFNGSESLAGTFNGSESLADAFTDASADMSADEVDGGALERRGAIRRGRTPPVPPPAGKRARGLWGGDVPAARVRSAGRIGTAPGAWGEGGERLEAERSGAYWFAYGAFLDWIKNRGTRQGAAAALARADLGLAAEAALWARGGIGAGAGATPRAAPVAWSEPGRGLIVRAPLGLVFDEEGRRHKWTRFEVAEGSFDGEKALAAARAAGEASGVASYACSVCGISMAAAGAGALDEARVQRAVADGANSAAAVEVFAALCPVPRAGGSGDDAVKHAFVAGVCSRCGFAPGLRTDPAAARAFLARNRTAFEVNRAEHRAVSVRVAAVSAAAAAAADASAAAAEAARAVAASYQPDFAPVIAAAARAGLRPAVLAAIGEGGLAGNNTGSTQLRDFADIEAGRVPPPPPSSAADPRLAAADAEVRRLLAEFGALRRSGARAVPPGWAAALLAAAGAPPGADVAAALAPAEGASAGKYAAEFAAVRALRPPPIALDFATEKFSRFANAIAESPRAGAPAWAAPLAAAAARRAILNAARALKVRTRPGAFNRALLRETIVEEIDPNTGDAGDVGEDDIADDAAARDAAEDDIGNAETGDFDATYDVEKDSSGNYINTGSDE